MSLFYMVFPLNFLRTKLNIMFIKNREGNSLQFKQELNIIKKKNVHKPGTVLSKIRAIRKPEKFGFLVNIFKKLSA